MNALEKLRAANVNSAGLFAHLASGLTRSGRPEYAVAVLEQLSEAQGPTPALAAVLVDSYEAMAAGMESVNSR